jgi:hypothetical protein
MGQDQSQQDTSRGEKLLFHTAFNRGIPVTVYLELDDMVALSQVSPKSRESVRDVIEKRGITIKRDSSDTDHSIADPKLWTVTLTYVGQNRIEFLKLLERDKGDLLGYINANTFIYPIRLTKLNEMEIEIEFTFACDAIDFIRKKEIDEDYIETKISDSIERLQDFSPYYYSLSVKDVKQEKPSKEGRRSKQKRSRRVQKQKKRRSHK